MRYAAIVKSEARMKACLCILAFTCFIVPSFGQGSIKGRVSDGKQNLPAANILLLRTDSSLVRGIVTDNSGEFIFSNVAAGRYLISATMVGYTRFFSEPVPLGDKEVLIPDIILGESVTRLDEFVVKGSKQLFDQQSDRLIVNVNGSSVSSGNTVLEVLQKSPGVVVNRQSNSISMNGKAGVRVMINGKIMQLPPDVVVQMLDGMSASNIERIELITSPPSKYDAEGTAGIIHIVSKEKDDYGTNGSFGLTAGARWAEALGGNFNAAHRSKKIAWMLDYAIVRSHNLHRVNLERHMTSEGFDQRVFDDSRRENITIQQNLNAGFEWSIGKTSLLSISFTGYRRNWDMNAFANDTYHVKIDSTVRTGMKIHESNIWQSGIISIGLQKKPDEKSQIDFNLDYLDYYNDNPSEYDVNPNNDQIDPNETSKIDLDKATPIHVFIARADYQRQVNRSFKWEAGIKGVTSGLDNDVLVQRNINDMWITDPVFTSYATLSEQIAAGYLSTSWQAANQWQIDGGVRYEYTHTSISTPDVKDLVNRKYGYLFPNLSVKKNIAVERDLRFSYSRRITRPTYNDIAPFIFFWGPNTFSAGNTSLYPAISDAVALGYHVKQWTFSAQFTHSANEITFLQPEVDSESNSLIYRSQNLKHLNTFGLTNSFSQPMTSWWDLQYNLAVQYQVAKPGHLPNNVTLYQYGVNISMMNQFRLPRNFSVEISGVYQSRLLTGISSYLPFGSLNAGIQKDLGKRGIIRLAMDDILYTNNWRIKTYSRENDIDSKFYYDWHNQFIRLTYTCSLGNAKLRSVKLKTGSEEERRRAVQ